MSRDASASEKNLTVKDTSVKTIVSPCGGVKCEYGEASALQSTEVLHPWGGVYRASQKKWCIAISNSPVLLDVQIF